MFLLIGMSPGVQEGSFASILRLSGSHGTNTTSAVKLAACPKGRFQSWRGSYRIVPSRKLKPTSLLLRSIWQNNLLLHCNKNDISRFEKAHGYGGCPWSHVENMTKATPHDHLGAR